SRDNPPETYMRHTASLNYTTKSEGMFKERETANCATKQKKIWLRQTTQPISEKMQVSFKLMGLCLCSRMGGTRRPGGPRRTSQTLADRGEPCPYDDMALR